MEKKMTFKGLRKRSKEGGKGVIKKRWGQCQIKRPPVRGWGRRKQ